MADQICGGVDSVFAYAALAVGLAWLRSVSFTTGLITLLFVPLWTVVGYTSRLLGIVWIHKIWQLDASVGWNFRWVEIGSILITTLLIVASLALFRKLFEPLNDIDSELDPIVSALNKLIVWPQQDPNDEILPDDPYELKVYFIGKAEFEAERARYLTHEWTCDRTLLWDVRVLAIVFLMLAIFPAISLARQGWSDLSFGRSDFPLETMQKLDSADTLPESLNASWVRTSYEKQTRSSRSRLPEHSYRWRYAMGKQAFDVALEFPLVGWSDPAPEYASRGWREVSHAIEDKRKLPWGQIEFTNEFGGSVYLFYGYLSASQEPYTLVAPHLLDDGGISANRSEHTPSTTTMRVQLMIESGAALSPEKLKLFGERFLELREHLLPSADPKG